MILLSHFIYYCCFYNVIAYIKVVALIFKNMNFMYDVNDTCIKLLKIVLIGEKINGIIRN
ncbi:hypothetical protein BU631_00450 [Staphylococcus caprae]|nr:hypothetical protein BU631_00450 [Staphylococcus caprae]